MLDMDFHKLLTTPLYSSHQILYITDDNYANVYLRAIKAPKCKDLFITVIDGTQHLYVQRSIPNECVPV